MITWVVSYRTDKFNGPSGAGPVEVYFQVYTVAGTIGAALLRSESVVQMMKLPALATAYDISIHTETDEEEPVKAAGVQVIKG